MIVIDSNDFVRFVFNQGRSAQRSVRGPWISSGVTVMTPCELELMIRYVLPRHSESLSFIKAPHSFLTFESLRPTSHLHFKQTLRSL